MQRKQLLIFILLMVFSLNSNAQLTADFPDSNYYWNESHSIRACDMSCPTYIVEGTMFDSTTHIKDGKLYRSIYFKGSQYKILHIFPSQVIDIYNFTQLRGYIFNDKLNKKVFFRENLSDTISDKLLFDFGLKLGDIYPITLQHKCINDSAYVFRIDTIVDPYGIERQIKYISGFGGQNLYGSGAIIDGIGTLTGLLSETIYGNYSWVGSNDLMCFTMDTLSYNIGNSLPSPVFLMSTTACNEHQYLSVIQNKITSISIYPNPTNNFVYVDVQAENIQLEITNTLGQIQQIKGKRDGSQWMFDVSDFQNGIYFLKVNTSEGAYSSKFIKL